MAKTILYKDLNKKKYQERPKRIIDIHIEEKPKRGALPPEGDCGI